MGRADQEVVATMSIKRTLVEVIDSDHCSALRVPTSGRFGTVSIELELWEVEPIDGRVKARLELDAAHAHGLANALRLAAASAARIED
jgi:hypothetical protein